MSKNISFCPWNHLIYGMNMMLVYWQTLEWYKLWVENDIVKRVVKVLIINLQVTLWGDYDYQIETMENQKLIMYNNKLNNTHIGIQSRFYEPM